MRPLSKTLRIAAMILLAVEITPLLIFYSGFGIGFAAIGIIFGLFILGSAAALMYMGWRLPLFAGLLLVTLSILSLLLIPGYETTLDLLILFIVPLVAGLLYLGSHWAETGGYRKVKV